MSKLSVPANELEGHLKDQLELLESSADAYDAGRTAEYRRMALAIRILVHDHKSSRALLGQLGRLEVDFLDTALPLNPRNIMPHSGLTMMLQGGPKTGFAAPLDGGPFRAMRPFKDWWNREVVKDDNSAILTRKDLVLIASNQDGGAHVDPGLDERYAAISRRNSLGHFAQKADGSWVELPDAERASIRQIAHEVLKTLKPGYAKSPDTEGVSLISMGALIEPSHHIQKAEIRLRPKAQARNERCACGSQKKYKHCCGMP